MHTFPKHAKGCFHQHDPFVSQTGNYSNEQKQKLKVLMVYLSMAVLGKLQLVSHMWLFGPLSVALPQNSTAWASLFWRIGIRGLSFKNLALKRNFNCCTVDIWLCWLMSLPTSVLTESNGNRDEPHYEPCPDLLKKKKVCCCWFKPLSIGMTHYLERDDDMLRSKGLFQPPQVGWSGCWYSAMQCCCRSLRSNILK